MPGFTCSALYKYEPKAADELQLQKHDKLTDCSIAEPGWYSGFSIRLNKKGVFPDNFVKKISDSVNLSTSNTAPVTPTKNEILNSTKKSISPSLPAKNPSLLSSSGQPPKPPQKQKSNEGLIPPKDKQVFYLAKFNYKGQNDDELNLEKNDKILHIRDVEDGWAEGKLRDRIGLYPTNFVEKCKEEPAANLQPGPNRKSLGPPVGGVKMPGLPSNIQITSNSTPSNPVPKPEPLTEQTSNPTPLLSNKKYVIATYPYKGAQADELTFKKNDRILLISKDAGDVGWWKGELDGKIGVFPDNFVKEDNSRQIVTGGAPVNLRNPAQNNNNSSNINKSPNSNLVKSNVDNNRPKSMFPVSSNSTTPFLNKNQSSITPDAESTTTNSTVINDNYNNKKNRPKGPTGKRPPGRGKDRPANDVNLWEEKIDKNTSETLNLDSDNEAPLASNRDSIKDRMQKISGASPMGGLFMNNQEFHKQIRFWRIEA